LSDPAVSVKVVRHTRAIYFCGKVRIGNPGIIDERIEGLGAVADSPLKPKPGLNGPPAINPAKTRHSSKGRTRRVTGITLGSDGKPYIGRGLKRKIRAMIHHVDALDAKGRGSLAGLIAYAGGFDPDFVNSLITKYGYSTVAKARIPPVA
jgi:hypothetical protein